MRDSATLQVLACCEHWTLDCSHRVRLAHFGHRFFYAASPGGTRSLTYALAGSNPSAPRRRKPHKSGAGRVRFYYGTAVGGDPLASSDHCQLTGRNSVPGNCQVRRLTSTVPTSLADMR